MEEVYREIASACRWTCTCLFAQPKRLVFSPLNGRPTGAFVTTRPNQTHGDPGDGSNNDMRGRGEKTELGRTRAGVFGRVSVF